MKKRIFALTLALILLFSFSSCELIDKITGKDKEEENLPSAMELLSKAMEAQADPMEYGSKTAINMNISASGSGMDMSMNMSILQSYAFDGENFKLDYSMTVLGEAMTMNMVYVDGVAYIKEDTEKYKATMSKTEMENYLDELDIINFLDDSDSDDADDSPFTEDVVKNAKVTKKDGIYTITMKLNSAQANEMFGFGDFGNTSEMTCNEFNVKIKMDEEYQLTSIVVNADMEGNIPGSGLMQATVEMTMSDFVLTKPTIKAPSDKNSYVDYDSVY